MEEQQTIQQLKAQLHELQSKIKKMQNEQKLNRKKINDDKRTLKRIQKDEIQKRKIEIQTYKAIANLFTIKKNKNIHSPRKGKTIFKTTKNAILAVRRKKN